MPRNGHSATITHHRKYIEGYGNVALEHLNRIYELLIDLLQIFFSSGICYRFSHIAKCPENRCFIKGDSLSFLLLKNGQFILECRFLTLQKAVFLFQLVCIKSNRDGCDYIANLLLDFFQFLGDSFLFHGCIRLRSSVLVQGFHYHREIFTTAQSRDVVFNCTFNIVLVNGLYVASIRTMILSEIATIACEKE